MPRPAAMPRLAEEPRLAEVSGRAPKRASKRAPRHGRTLVMVSTLAVIASVALTTIGASASTAAPGSVFLLRPVLTDSGSDTKDLAAKKAAVDSALTRANSTYESATAAVQTAAGLYETATEALPAAQSALAVANGSVISASVAVDQTTAAVVTAQANVVSATTVLTSAEQQVVATRAAIAGVASAVYQGSNFLGLNALLTNGSPSDVLNRFGYADQIVATQHKMLNTYIAARMRAKDASNTANATAGLAVTAQANATAALTKSQQAKAAAQRATDNVAALVSQRQAALGVAQKNKSATLALYHQLQQESDQVAAELRAAAARDRAIAKKTPTKKTPTKKTPTKKTPTKKTPTKSGSSGSTGLDTRGGGTYGYFIMPVHGWKSSNFGMRYDPFYHRWQLHAGVDIAAGGGTPIRAARAGRVIRAGWDGGYGNYTCIDNGLYHGKGIATCYGHQSKILVHPGQHVAVGQIIGRVGETGAATGYHLHFEVRINGRPVQPLNWLPKCFC